MYAGKKLLGIQKKNIVQADIINLPIKNEQIDTVIFTFPTNVILLLPLYDEVFRILTLKGRLIIVDYPYFHNYYTLWSLPQFQIPVIPA